LVDRGLLQEVVRSFSTLFGMAMRVFSAEGVLLADSVDQQSICKYINTVAEGRSACNATVATIKRVDPGLDGQLVHPCFSGANYKIVSICYDARVVGKLILGPYLPADVKEVPGSLTVTAPALEPTRLRELLPRMPRAKADTVSHIANHMRAMLDLILFSGHKAFLTSQMHLASVRESYRELQDKNSRLQKAYDKLRELDRLKSNFIATVSHELRTPLTSIIGYSEMLAEGIAGELRPEQQEFVGTIREKSEQLLGLIMSLLDLSKLESGSLSLQKTDLDMRDVLKDIVTSLVPNARKKTVTLNLEVPAEPTTIRGDANRLRQVFLNLADNALKFTPAGGEIRLGARVALDSSVEGDDAFGFALLAPAKTVLEVYVADTGIGIPEAERVKVFDPFYQVDSSSTREYGGTGLGLAIVKRLVEAHDGKIRIDANEPKGAIFVVTLPVVQSHLSS
jgi:signal transduction histidine kinase